MSNPYFLSKGKHQSADEGRCAMEFVSHLAGELHSDHPRCVSPVLTWFGIVFNDSLPDDERQRLRPYLARMIGTRNDGLDDQRRWRCVDWLLRICAPAWLDLAAYNHPLSEWDKCASDLRMLPPLITIEDVYHAMRMVYENLNTIEIPPVSITHPSVVAMRKTTGPIGGAYPRGSAALLEVEKIGGIIKNVARDAYEPTVFRLQRSLFDLLDQMLPTEIIQLPVAEDAERICAMV